jgi:hypothetical protein
VQSRRDAGITALVEGFFAMAWFGWGQEGPPAWLVPILVTGSLVGFAVAVTGAIVGFRSPKETAVLRDRAAFRRYGIVVGVEFGLAGIGAGILGGTGQAAYIPVWICAVVGVHFFALAPVLGDRNLIPLGAILCIVALAALIAGLATEVLPSAVTGVGAGAALAGFGIAALVRAFRTAPAA